MRLLLLRWGVRVDQVHLLWRIFGLEEEEVVESADEESNGARTRMMKTRAKMMKTKWRLMVRDER